MGDPKTIRINDAEDPRRLDRLEKTLKKAGQNLSEVFRHCADAYIRFTEIHGHGPTFPIRIEQEERQEQGKRKKR